ncbi:Protein SMG8 [Cryptotermes secundus]|uniref:Nonsense-mediated mRNA decay factor SMG8 n=1 Tax=Cryptotermes secundus TaxID=105785 RepID=A0A2J7RA93_9NEOP|nr:protein SMG8 isoform X2 [Cryptotermes secundus]PNF37753.1 Protein SMG8 [Cryptotermes secundus]
MRMRTKKFKLPHIPSGKDVAGLLEQKVIVVSVFGKSPYSAGGCKAGLIDGFPGHRVFHTSLIDDPDVDQDLLCDIEGYHDPKQRVIYLHLRGVFDVHTLVKSYDLFSKELEEKGYLSVWADMKYRYARALMFLFSVSHILIISHPTHIFDISYVHLFRALDVMRQKVLGGFSEILRTIPGLSEEWITNCRPCSPRVLFLFESCPAIYLEGRANVARTGSGFGGKYPSIKKLEHALEDQIYHILRKSRVITNISSNSLFAIPANQEFVFVQTKVNPLSDRNAHMVNSLVDFCKDPNNDCSRNKEEIVNTFSTLHLEPNDHSFRSFLQQHIDQAFTKGFDDNVGRHTAHGYFEIPTAGVWFEVSDKAFNMFLSCDQSPDSKSKSQLQHQFLSSLRGLLDTDVRFSEGRCGKVLPLAIATYQENLPPQYTRDYHESKLAHALSVFAVHARGPLFDQYTAQLEKECDRYWKNGRQMCEVLSLTGNPCTNPLHRGGGEGAGGGELQEEANKIHDDTDPPESHDRTQLPLMEHSSGVRYISACNCGRKQGPREDPFTMRAANYDFYQLLGEDCGCNNLESIRFPVFQPSTQDYRAAQLFSNRTAPGLGWKDGGARGMEGRELNVGTPQGNTQGFSLAGFVSGQSVGSDIIPEETVSRLSPNPPRADHSLPDTGHEIIIQVSDAETDSSKDKSLVRQPSTTEYLPGMLHAASPAGLLPQFPSWSLVCLGPSSLYSHNLGLQDQQQAGLLGGSAYLLPWDVTVRLEHHRDRGSGWPTVGDQYASRGKMQVSSQHSGTVLRGRKGKGGNKDLSEFVVKIFVGVEYECPRGHRFMCSAPGKVLKTTGSGLVKDNGNKVTSNDMPLYFPCPCRNVKPLVAQLMRIHVVTPKAPIHVTLNPRVQPAPSPCPVFVTGCEQPLRLSQSAYWVLRLPSVYVGEHGPYVTPKQPVPLSYGRLLAGVYGITEVQVAEEK